MKKIFIANWKENPGTEREAIRLYEATKTAGRTATNVTMVVCPPFIYLEKIGERVRRSRLRLGLVTKKSENILLGAQDVSYREAGAHTGEVGPKMLKRLGVQYVIVGHSERRAAGETDTLLNKKVYAALADRLKVILCVGESAAIRKGGVAAAKRWVSAQLTKDLKGLANRDAPPITNRLLIAYEPIWAIGSGKNDPPEDAQAMAAFIKKEAKKILRTSYVPVLYGGSVNSKDVGDYVQYKEIDGALVGGASLHDDEIKKMLAIVDGR
jgi:triosephosphate isomerase